MANKIEFGLSHIMFAELTKTTSATGEITHTYAKPVALPGAQGMTMDAQGETTTIYADDGAWYSPTANNGYSGEITFVHYSDEIRNILYKQTAADNGTIVERADIMPAEGAILFECQGDAGKTRHILYDVNFGNPSQEYKTQEEGIEPSTITIPYTATAIELSDGKKVIKGKCSSADAGYATFFTTAAVPTFTA